MFWIIFVVVSTVLCSILIVDSLESLHANSVIIAFDEKIWNKEEASFDTLGFKKFFLCCQEDFGSNTKTIIFLGSVPAGKFLSRLGCCSSRTKPLLSFG